MPYENKVYTHFRFISYEVPTHRPVATGPAPAEVPRVPVPPATPDSSPDARSRLRRLAAVINAAYEAYHGADLDDRNTTLKIFVVPEFYFRPNVDAGVPAYTQAQASDLMNSLLEMFQHADFTHWLFVCGTFVAANTLNGPDFYQNTCIVIKGGPGDERRYSVIQKQNFSDIDGVPIDSTPHALPHIKKVYEKLAVMKNYVFHNDHRRIGFEICLDHPEAVLKKALMYYDFVTDGAVKEVDLQIVIACGSYLNNNSIATKHGGYIFRCDGSPSMKRHAVLYPVRVVAPHEDSDDDDDDDDDDDEEPEMRREIEDLIDHYEPIAISPPLRLTIALTGEEVPTDNEHPKAGDEVEPVADNAPFAQQILIFPETTFH